MSYKSKLKELESIAKQHGIADIAEGVYVYTARDDQYRKSAVDEALKSTENVEVFKVLNDVIKVLNLKGYEDIKKEVKYRESYISDYSYLSPYSYSRYLQPVYKERDAVKTVIDSGARRLLNDLTVSKGAIESNDALKRIQKAIKGGK